jgi:predicted signal transduction protein with EAL and GGDEF domain
MSSPASEELHLLLIADESADAELIRNQLRRAGINFTFDDAKPEIEKLIRLREAGVKTAIDSFGTGYSSLSRISSLPSTSSTIGSSACGQVYIPRFGTPNARQTAKAFSKLFAAAQRHPR